MLKNGDRSHSLTSNLISPRTEINSRIEADKEARGFTAFIASGHGLSKSKITSELKKTICLV
jgi:hypothetical protein